MSQVKPDLRAAYRALDPASPLESPLLSALYCARRPVAPMGRLAQKLKERSQPLRAIVAGQRGVGKTTELHWLQGELERASPAVFKFDLGAVVATNAVTALALLTKELGLNARIANRGEFLRQSDWLDRDFRVFRTMLPPAQLTEVLGTLTGIVAAITQPAATASLSPS